MALQGGQAGIGRGQDYTGIIQAKPHKERPADPRGVSAFLLAFCMTYDQQILCVLAEAGNDGASVRAVARHVYNMNVSLFSSPDFKEIHAYVQRFLQRHSRSARALVESTGRWGHYRISRKGVEETRQYVLEFRSDDDTGAAEEEAPRRQDLSLSLFD